MNAQTIGGIVRAVIGVLAGYLAGKGIDITGLASPEVTGAIGLVVTSVWSVMAKKKAAEAPAKPLDT